MNDPITRALLGLVAFGAAGCPSMVQSLYGGPPMEPIQELDVDGDGHGTKTDCDDSDATVHPGAEDATEDGVDQNCDGRDGPAAEPSGSEAPEVQP